LIGAPFSAFNSLSRTLAGSVVSTGCGAGASRTGAAGVLAEVGADGRVSSLELQLDTPIVANKESTAIVKANRAGVHNGFWDSAFMSGI
jgi:hypothetical protein